MKSGSTVRIFKVQPSSPTLGSDSISAINVNNFLEAVGRVIDEDKDLSAEKKEELARKIDNERILCLG